MMTDQEKLKTLARRVRDDFGFFSPKYLWIRDKQAQEVQLVPNGTQRFVLDAWQRQESAGKPVRLLILKARKKGVSTIIEARFFHRTITRKNTSTIIVAHDEESSVGLFEIVKLYNDKLPDALRPMQRYSNRKELVFENPSEVERRSKPGLRSRLSVATARNLQTGRSKTPTLVLLSEAAYYPDLKALLKSIRQAVPDNPGTAVVIESTANGVGDDFHALWQAAKRGENDYIPIFVPWFHDDEYQLPFVSEAEQQRFMESLTAEEHATRKAYALTPDQLHWRREKIKQFDTIEEFFQEYPENDVDCFLSSGSHALPVKDIQAMQKTAKPPKWRGYLETYLDERDPKNPVEKIRFVEDSKGPLSIWKLPKPGGQYAGGADTSEGIPGGDYSVVDVVDKETAEQVAQWHGLIDPDLFGSEVLANLGWFYNTAILGPERNNDGKTVLLALKTAGYSNLFRSVQVDERTNRPMNKLGWLTTTQSKHLLVNEIRQRFRERSVIINSAATLDECLSFVRLPDGSLGAQTNAKDDRVISLGIVLQVIKHHPYIPPRRALRRRQHELAPAYGPH